MPRFHLQQIQQQILHFLPKPRIQFLWRNPKPSTTKWNLRINKRGAKKKFQKTEPAKTHTHTSSSKHRQLINQQFTNTHNSGDLPYTQKIHHSRTTQFYTHNITKPILHHYNKDQIANHINKTQSNPHPTIGNKSNSKPSVIKHPRIWTRQTKQPLHRARIESEHNWATNWTGWVQT